MNRSLTRIFLFFALTFLIVYPFAAQADVPSYKLGDQVYDFTFTTYDSQKVTLSEVLQEKDAVLINIWASWCGPCRNEFPYMQAAYEQYQEQVEVFALSCEPTDTADTLAAFAEKYQLTFKIGQDPVGFLYTLGANSIPTTLMIDRFGTICYIQSGAFPDESSFSRLFEAVLTEDYTESIILDAIPPKKPDIAPSTEAALAQALNAEGSQIVFRNHVDSGIWPMVVKEIDGRIVAASSNQGIGPSKAAVVATISASEGDALVISFKLSSEPIFDAMELRVNDRVVKSFAGDEAWQTYTYAFPSAGEYRVEVSYTKNNHTSVGRDTLWIDSIYVASGNDAIDALTQNPAYPISDQIGITVLNGNAREITITDPTGNIAARYGSSTFYLIPDDKAKFHFSMVEKYDPETAIVYFNYDGKSYALSDCLTSEGYVATSAGDSINTTGYCDSSVILYPDLYTPGYILTYFKSESDIDVFLSALTKDFTGNVMAEWSYVADSAPTAAGAVDRVESDEDVVYTLRCVDQHGNPVSGAMLQVCDESTCQVLRSDDNGICSFSAAPYAWEIHILRSPDGYTAESTEVILAPITGGEMVFFFQKI